MQDSSIIQDIVQGFYNNTISSVPDKFIISYEENRELLLKESIETGENVLLKRIKGSSGRSEDTLAARVLQLESAIIQYSKNVQQRRFDEAQTDSQTLLKAYSICTRDYYDGMRRREQSGNRPRPREEVRFFIHRLFLDLVSIECWKDSGLMLDISAMCYRLMRNWNRQNGKDIAFKNYYNITAENDIVNRYFDNICSISELFDASFLKYMPRPSAFVTKEYVVAFLDALFKLNEQEIKREEDSLRRYGTNLYEEDMISFQRWKAILIGLAAIVFIILAAAIGYVFGARGKVDPRSVREQQIEMDSGIQSEKTEQTETGETEQAENEQAVTDRTASSNMIIDETGETQTEEDMVQTGQKAVSGQENDSKRENGDHIYKGGEAEKNAESKVIIDRLQQSDSN